MAVNVNDLSAAMDVCAPWTATLGECLEAAGCERDCPTHLDADATSVAFPENA